MAMPYQILSLGLMILQMNQKKIELLPRWHLSISLMFKDYNMSLELVEI